MGTFFLVPNDAPTSYESGIISWWISKFNDPSKESCGTYIFNNYAQLIDILSHQYPNGFDLEALDQAKTIRYRRPDERIIRLPLSISHVVHSRLMEVSQDYQYTPEELAFPGTRLITTEFYNYHDEKAGILAFQHQAVFYFCIYYSLDQLVQIAKQFHLDYLIESEYIDQLGFSNFPITSPLAMIAIRGGIAEKLCFVFDTQAIQKRNDYLETQSKNAHLN